MQTKYDLDAMVSQLLLDVNATGRIARSVEIGRKLSVDGHYWTATVFFLDRTDMVTVSASDPDAAAAKALNEVGALGSVRIEALRKLQEALVDANAKGMPEPLKLPATRLANALVEELGDA